MGEQRRTYPAGLKRDALEMLKTSGKSTAEPPRVYRRPVYVSPAPKAKTSCSV